MSSSSSSSPEITPAGRADSPHERFTFTYATQEDVLEDLSSRFILNLPEEELASLERICFQVEQAHWFYEDFVREENPKFPSLPLKKFSAMLFHSCPLLHQWSHAHEQAFTNFMQYKTRVPVCGAIMLNESWEKCLLVKGWKSSSGWGFPKGKINEDEPQTACAVREVLEETGYNLAGKISAEDVIEMSIREQKIALYIVPGVPEDFPFKTKTRKEISKIEWFRLADLPTWKRNRTAAGKFYLITPFISALKVFIHDRKPRTLPRKPPKHKRQLQDVELAVNDHESTVTDSPCTPYQDAHQESSSQSSSADNGDPQTPSPQCSQSFANPIDIAPQAETPLDPHFARLLSSLTLSGAAVEAKKDHQPVKPTLLLSQQGDGPRERSTPVPAMSSSARPLLPEAPAGTKSPSMIANLAEAARASYTVPHASSPPPRSPIAFRLQTKSPTMNGRFSPETPPSNAFVPSPRPTTSRRTSSLADISPYLSKSIEIPSSAKRLRQLALLESVADESARLTPYFASREAAALNVNGMAHLHHLPPLPPASVPPQAIGTSDSNIIYSSGPSALYQGMNIPQIPFRSPVQDDPFQVRPRTSQAINRPVYHSPPSGSMSMNQSQLLAVMNATSPPLLQSRPSLPHVHNPPVHPSLPPSSHYHAPPFTHPELYSPMTIPPTSISTNPPPGIISSSQPQILLTSTISPMYGQANSTNSLLSILNQRR
ncbi:hypothetical protein E1B28_001070 [Marasmius oreades]|uniref:Nudix hydrolase domain-containing protein n=1 Tax=Marasmius oreades TaxID=181124 RepID=A0A9P7V2N8_9AGAR|nr:uncharacterized protein E1B28_001070 [Marasmius oreades]KAG7099203.1 hypothetical protein E1B28_001070 [Marasmius oreades]